MTLFVSSVRLFKSLLIETVAALKAFIRKEKHHGTFGLRRHYHEKEEGDLGWNR